MINGNKKIKTQQSWQKMQCQTTNPNMERGTVLLTGGQVWQKVEEQS